MIKNHKVAIVIIGKNEASRLASCIESAIKQVEQVVYVDSASTDDSVSIANKYKIKTLSLNKNTRINAAIARNVGAKWILSHDKNVEYIQFLDADTTLDVNWIENAFLQIHQNISIGAIAGRLREKHLGESIYIDICDMGWYCKPGYINSLGGIFLLRKEIFINLNGFNENLLVGEDPELSKRIIDNKHKILCIENIMGFHDSGMYTFRQWFIRNVKTGYGYANGRSWGAWSKQVYSILFWSILILLVLGLSFVKPEILYIYPVLIIQIIKTAFNLEIPYTITKKLLFATSLMVGKLPQFFGVCTFYLNKLLNKNLHLQYK